MKVVVMIRISPYVVPEIGERRWRFPSILNYGTPCGIPHGIPHGIRNSTWNSMWNSGCINRSVLWNSRWNLQLYFVISSCVIGIVELRLIEIGSIQPFT